MQHIPVLNDLSVVIQPEDVDPCPVAVLWPVLVAVKDHEVVVRQDPAELHALAWILARHSFEVLDEGLLPVCHDGIVLDVRCSNVRLDGFDLAVTD